MTFEVIILPRAEADMERNATWWAEHHSIAHAVEWFECVHNQLKSLADNPERHGLSMENADFHYEVRDLLVGLAMPRTLPPFNQNFRS